MSRRSFGVEGSNLLFVEGRDLPVKFWTRIHALQRVKGSSVEEALASVFYAWQSGEGDDEEIRSLLERWCDGSEEEIAVELLHAILWRWGELEYGELEEVIEPWVSELKSDESRELFRDAVDAAKALDGQRVRKDLERVAVLDGWIE